MSEEEKSESEKEDARELYKGLGLTVVMHSIFAAILYGLFLLQGEGDYSFLLLLPLLGITQAVYMIPVFVLAKGKGKDQLAKGLLVGAAITFLLNAACTGLILLDVLR